MNNSRSNHRATGAGVTIPMLFVFLGWLGSAEDLSAHQPSDSYLAVVIAEKRISVRWDVALRDLEYAVGLDGDGDGKITWGELRGRWPEVTSYLLPHFELLADGRPLRLSLVDPLVERRREGTYAVLSFDATAASPIRDLEVRYGAFFELDPGHRGLLRLEAGTRKETAVFSPDRPVRSFDLGGVQRTGLSDQFVREGIRHIWLGYDHLLFLIALLLPAALERRAGGWSAAKTFRSVGADAFRTVTAFTVAHSLTLGLSALGLVALPGRLVESCIAASVGVAALHNLWPVLRCRAWVLGFSFGLLHGFGFAGAMLELGLDGSSLVTTLLSFNLGVEIGQLIIVAGLLPCIFWARNSVLYRAVALRWGSMVIALLAMFWMVERIFEG